MGRIKYFFKKGKIKKEQIIELNNQDDKNEEKTTEIKIEEKEYYTIEELLETCKIFERLNTELKNKMLDKKALEYKVENISIKLQNAIQYIEEINEHKKSLFEFWKFANKDSVLGLSEGNIQENKVRDIKVDITLEGTKLNILVQYEEEIKK